MPLTTSTATINNNAAPQSLQSTSNASIFVFVVLESNWPQDGHEWQDWIQKLTCVQEHHKSCYGHPRVLPQDSDGWEDCFDRIVRLYLQVLQPVASERVEKLEKLCVDFHVLFHSSAPIHAGSL